jgi:hypothetical protein
MAHRQVSDIVETLMQQFIGVKRRNVARRQPPQYAVHSVARAWRNRAPAIETNEEAITVEYSRTNGTDAWTATLHRKAMHIGAIGEIERHRPRIADL